MTISLMPLPHYDANLTVCHTPLSFERYIIFKHSLVDKTGRCVLYVMFKYCGERFSNI